MKKTNYTFVTLTLVLLLVVICQMNGTRGVLAEGPSATPSGDGSSNTQYVPLSPLPCIGNSTVCPNGSNPATVSIKGYIQATFNLLIALASVTAVFMIVWGGFEYMTTDAISGKEAGREKLFNALKGLLLILCSYLILRTINPQFVNVPDTLVAPLGLREHSTASDWATSLQNSIEQDKIKRAENVSAMLQAHNSGNTAKENELIQQINQNQEVTDQKTVQLVVGKNKEAVQAILSDTNAQPTTQASAIMERYNQDMGALSPDGFQSGYKVSDDTKQQVTDLKDQSMYNLGTKQLDLVTNTFKDDPSKMQQAIDSGISTRIMPNISDEVLKNKLQNQINQTLTQYPPKK